MADNSIDIVASKNNAMYVSEILRFEDYLRELKKIDRRQTLMWTSHKEHLRELIEDSPEGFTVEIREVYMSAGAGFVVAIAGSIMTMPGLPKRPAAEMIDINENGDTVGLF